MINYDLSAMHWGAWAPFAGIGIILSLALLVWSLYWKGMALWKAAREGHQKWFIALLLINTIGILEILYIYHFSEKKAEPIAPVEQK